MMEIKQASRKTVFASLEGIYSKPGDFVEVTEWTNGEGFDININDKPIISLHETEWFVLKKLIKNLNKNR